MLQCVAVQCVYLCMWVLVCVCEGHTADTSPSQCNILTTAASLWEYVAVCCGALRCVAVLCSVLQCVAMRCIVREMCLLKGVL